VTFFVNFGLLKPGLVIRVLIITYDPRPAGARGTREDVSTFRACDKTSLIVTSIKFNGSVGVGTAAYCKYYWSCDSAHVSSS
jgi:hypothetical protein